MALHCRRAAAALNNRRRFDGGSSSCNAADAVAKPQFRALPALKPRVMVAAAPGSSPVPATPAGLSSPAAAPPQPLQPQPAADTAATPNAGTKTGAGAAAAAATGTREAAPAALVSEVEPGVYGLPGVTRPDDLVDTAARLVLVCGELQAQAARESRGGACVCMCRSVERGVGWGGVGGALPLLSAAC